MGQPHLVLWLLLLLAGPFPGWIWSLDAAATTREDPLPVGKMLAMFDYPYEEYHTMTKDGYILQVDRIPRPGRPPVILASPLFSASPVFFLLGPGTALGLLLYDAGFDVWSVNIRGAAYSPDHLRLTTADVAYWQFSFHEHGTMDFPAGIDLVLAKTGFPQVMYVGFSMGTTSFFIMNSLRPDMNAKVRAAFLMAPIAALYYSPNTFLRIIKSVVNSTLPAALRYIYRDSFPHATFRRVQQTLCGGEVREVCNQLYRYLGDATMNQDYVGSTNFFSETFPASGSFPTLWHFAQLARAPNIFKPYDYGIQKNLRVYGRSAPPDYPVHNITTPIYCYRGAADTFVNSKDFVFIKRNMRSLVKEWVHPDPNFAHFDFMFIKDAKLAYDEVIRDMMANLEVQN